MHFPALRHHQQGFTLVEMIVAAILLVVGVVAALACIGAATRSTSLAAEYTTAALLAQQRLAEIEAQPDQLSSGDQQGDFGEAFPGYTWHQTVETTDLSGLVRVTLTIEWPSGATRRSAQFVTYEQTQTQQPLSPAQP
jgi:prepilin-type N-terminal cleavage/methylation domain-containing protein